MGADSVVVFFGTKQMIAPEELLDVQDRTDARFTKARKARLKVYWGRVTDGAEHFILVGQHIGTFGVENQAEAALTESELLKIIDETTRRLCEFELDVVPPRLHIQLVAQY